MTTRHSNPTAPNTRMAAEFLEWLLEHAPDGVFLELTALAPHGSSLRPRILSQSFEVVRGIARGINWQKVADVNMRGYGIHYGVTLKSEPVQVHQRSNEANTACVVALWADFDGADFKGGADGEHDEQGELIAPGALDALLSVSPAAQAVVASGGGYHALWRIEPLDATAANSELVRGILRGMAEQHGADVQATDLARTLRLPGTINTKPNRGNLCHVASYAWYNNRPRSVQDFLHYKPKPQKRISKRAFTRAEREVSELPYIRDYLNTHHQPGTRNHALNNAAFYLYSNGYPQNATEQVLLQHAVNEGLGEREVKAVIRSVYASKPGQPSTVPQKISVRAGASDELQAGTGTNVEYSTDER